MKDIKDYLHLYLGCDVMVTPPESAPFPCKLTGFVTERTDDDERGRVQVFEADGEEGFEGFGIRWFDEDEIELLLRPLSDMTVEEKTEEYNIGLDPGIEEQFRWLLSKGFDLFNLHEQGLCLYKSDLQCEKK